MLNKFILAAFALNLSLCGFGQESEPAKSSNFFGVSFDIGGGLELDDRRSTSDQVTPSTRTNIGASLFWEHRWYFSKNHGLIFGGGINWMGFSPAVTYEYGLPSSNESLSDNLSQLSRTSVISLDLPLYYTYRIKSGIGEFNPYLGVNVRTVAGLIDQVGYVGQTDDMIYKGVEYFSTYDYEFDLSRVAPILQPTLGLSFTRALKNGARINYSIDYKLFLDNAFSYVTVKCENTFNQRGGYLITPGGGVEPVESIPVDVTTDNLKVNMSRFSAGVSYSFK